MRALRCDGTLHYSSLRHSARIILGTRMRYNIAHKDTLANANTHTQMSCASTPTHIERMAATQNAERPPQCAGVIVDIGAPGGRALIMRYYL